MTTASVVYDLDASDNIVSVNDAWDRFAAENESASVGARNVVGRSLWDFISDPTTREIYRRLFASARGGSAPSSFQFRCDAPSIRRLLEMEIRFTDGVVRCTVRTVNLENREPQLLLDPAVERSEELLRMCSWCKRIPDGAGVWHEIDDAVSLAELFRYQRLPVVTHGICEECSTVMMDSISVS